MSWLVQTHTAPDGIDAATWNTLLRASPRPTPFMRHEWLAALHETGCATPGTGWTPLFLSARQGEGVPIDAVCALYLKAHSYGEYVFDWAWANAHEQAGLPYYPKLLCASPFTPVPGSRLLARHGEARQALLAAIVQYGQQAGCSSAHVLFPDEADVEAARQAGWLLRQGVQFHWTNGQDTGPYRDMADFLGSLHRDKRKKIQQERRRVADAGVTVQARQGGDIRAQDWDVFHECYRRTYVAHGGHPYLNRAFFEQVSHSLSAHWLMFIASQDGRPVAASLIGVDPAQGVAYGRYWGALAHVPCLHFELCYYAPLAWCITQGFTRFEGGAQGEHKMARGLMPTPTWSAHWLRDARFSDAVAHYLARESAGIDAYVDELHERGPFKPAP